MRPDLQARLNATKVPYTIYTDYVEDTAMEQFADCLEQPSVVQAALMPDTHTGYVAPIGSVIKTEGTIFPSFVGYDIGCGMSSITIDNITTTDITTVQWEKIKNQILRDVPIGFNRHKKTQIIPHELASTNVPKTDFARQILLDTGQYQLGTLGGGNHFLEIGSTNSGNIAIVIHSGSRGVGHKVASHYMKEAALVDANHNYQKYVSEFHERNSDWWNAVCRDENKLSVYNNACDTYMEKRIDDAVSNIEDAYPLDTNSQTGLDYINDMNMALEFALANRKQMIDKCLYAIERVLQTNLTTSRFINKNHNHAELVGNYWIHRKGATQAAEGMMGVIPGNMVDGSFIVRGKGSPDSMNSSSHGAGRILSRRKAKEQLSVEDFNECTAHLIANHSDSNVDEAPKAYKNIFDVMDNQSDLVEVLDRVIPILNIKG